VVDTVEEEEDAVVVDMAVVTRLRDAVEAEVSAVVDLPRLPTRVGAIREAAEAAVTLTVAADHPATVVVDTAAAAAVVVATAAPAPTNAAFTAT